MIALETCVGWAISCDQAGYHFRGNHSGELLLEPLKLKGESLMIHAQQAKHSGIEIANMNRILDDVIAEIIGLPVNVTRFRSASGHPCGEAARMMIAAVVVFR